MGKCTKELTSGDCVLGEHYARYVLGLGVNKRDDATKAQVIEAREYFAKNLGIMVATNDDLNALRESPDKYYAKVKTWASDVENVVPRVNVERAHTLMKSLGFDMAPGSWKSHIDGYVSFGIKPPASNPPVNPSPDTQTSGSTADNLGGGAGGAAAPPPAQAEQSFIVKYKWPLIIVGGLLVVTTIIVIVKK